jgi:cobalt-zinc-cadmium efflux system membrane fusion protein
MHRLKFPALLLASLLLAGCVPTHIATAAVSPTQLISPMRNSADGVMQLTEKQVKFVQIVSRPAVFSNLTEDLEFSSVVEAPSDEIGIVSPQMNGIVTRVLADVGDSVQKGQILLYVSSPDLAEAQSNYFHALSKLEEVKAEASLIRTRLALANIDVARLQSLVKDGISARRDMENAQVKAAATNADLVASLAAANAATAQLSSARLRLLALGAREPSSSSAGFTSELALRSPKSGTVIQRNVVPGQGVGPGGANNSASGTVSGQTGSQNAAHALMAIARLRKVWVMLEVPQSQVSRLKVGSRVKFHSEVAPGIAFFGVITRLGQNFDQASHCVQVRTEIDNASGLLKPGMLIIASVHLTSGKPPGIVVPASAVQNIDGADYVFIDLGGCRFAKRPVSVVLKEGGQALLSGRINSGEQVVTGGAFFLKTEAVKAAMGGEP